MFLWEVILFPEAVGVRPEDLGHVGGARQLAAKCTSTTSGAFRPRNGRSVTVTDSHILPLLILGATI